MSREWTLNSQDYPNLRLYIRDDCSPTVPYDDILALVARCITAFPFFIEQNEENLGSNKTFERLTVEAEGEYFAYCDQDDVWLPEKLTALEAEMRKPQVGIVCSDVFPIDASGKQIASSITELRPRHVLLDGADLSGKLIYRNFAIGCTMLIRSRIAKSAVPFAESMVHDHYLAWFTAREHEIRSIKSPLIWYRIHEGNQTGVLAGITTKRDYMDLHLNVFVSRVHELSGKADSSEMKVARRWADARRDNAKRIPGAAKALWTLRSVNISTTVFELVALRLPDPLFRLAVRAIQKGKIWVKQKDTNTGCPGRQALQQPAGQRKP